MMRRAAKRNLGWLLVMAAGAMAAGVAWADTIKIKPLPLTIDKSEVHHVAVSPDGQLIAYSARVPGKPKHDLVLLSAPGPSGVKTKRVAQGVGATFSPDSADVLFYTEAKADNRYWLATVPTQGRIVEKDWKALGVDPSAALPKFSPEGDAIIYVNQQGTHLLDLETGDSERLTTKSIGSPQWHPGGNVVAFERRGGGISLMDVTNNVIKDITGSGGRKPRWSPNGRQLLFIDDLKVTILDLATQDKRRIGQGVDAIWTNYGLAVVLFGETDTETEGESFPMADLRLTWVPLAEGAQSIVLMDKAHTAAARGRALYVGVHREGLYKLNLPLLDSDREARKSIKEPPGLRLASPDEAAGQAEGQPRKLKPPTKRPNKPIDPDVLKAVQ